VPLVEDTLTGREALPLKLALLAAGPPCQPFSNAGLNLGPADLRDGFPIVLKAMMKAKPRAILLENVKGFLASRHSNYRKYILCSLEKLGYKIHYKLIDAADFGVPQRRQRVFIVGFLDSLSSRRFTWPAPTHSLEALVYSKYVLKSLPGGDRPPSRVEAATARLLVSKAPRAGTARHSLWSAAVANAGLLPWVTMRAALNSSIGLIDIGQGGYYGKGARHKSLLYKNALPDLPSATIQASAEAKGSEHAIRVVTKDTKTSLVSYRRLTILELATLQGFPTDWPWQGPHTQQYKQIGNAAPPPLVTVVAAGINKALQ
jgi:DNA (cytosine-5)-methyltransferase 1